MMLLDVLDPLNFHASVAYLTEKNLEIRNYDSFLRTVRGA